MKTINLTVPFFSQRDNNYIWHYKREKDEEIKKKTLKKGSPVTDSAGNEITSKIWDKKALYYGEKATLKIKTFELSDEKPTCKLQLWEKDYTTEDDSILEQDITFDSDEVETEIEFNFDIEKVLDEEFDGEIEIFCRIIYEEKDIASKRNTKLIVRTQGAKR